MSCNMITNNSCGQKCAGAACMEECRAWKSGVRGRATFAEERQDRGSGKSAGAARAARAARATRARERHDAGAARASLERF